MYAQSSNTYFSLNAEKFVLPVRNIENIGQNQPYKFKFTSRKDQSERQYLKVDNWILTEDQIISIYALTNFILCISVD